MNRDSARDFLKLRKDVVLALFFGNPRAEKGLDVLLKAFTDMAKKEEHKLLIAGKPGKSAEQDARLFGELPYGVLDIRRHLDDHETIAAFLAADFLVMPYLRVYESGVSLMALSLGRYVVASSLDPFISVLGGGEFGLLAEPGSVDDLKAKMTKAFSMSRNERDTIGQLGQSATFEKRGLSEIGRRTAESYRFALGKADV
jgi:glycosyltransferase involved in cell wall biosynthesis